MLLIEDVTKIYSVGDTLVLETKSGVDVAFKKDKGPNYINIDAGDPISPEGATIIVIVTWDSPRL